MFSKRSRTVNIIKGLVVGVGVVPLQLKTREKKIAPLRKKNRTGRTTLKIMAETVGLKIVRVLISFYILSISLYLAPLCWINEYINPLLNFALYY